MGADGIADLLNKLEHDFLHIDAALCLLTWKYHNGGLPKNAVGEELVQLTHFADSYKGALSSVSGKILKFADLGSAAWKHRKEHKGPRGNKKKPMKHEYLKGIDIKMERQMARDRPFNPFRPPVKRFIAPRGFYFANDVHSGFKVPLMEIKQSPGVLMPRSRYIYMKSTAATARWALIFTAVMGRRFGTACGAYKKDSDFEYMYTHSENKFAEEIGNDICETIGEEARKAIAKEIDTEVEEEVSRKFVQGCNPECKCNGATEIETSARSAIGAALREAAFASEHTEPEEVSAILSRRAQDEAQRCIASDRSLDHVQLRAALIGGSDRFNKLLMGRLPYHVLLDLKAKDPWRVLGLPSSVKVPLLGDVVNTALLGESQQCRKAWLRRPLPLLAEEESLIATSMSPELQGGMLPMFSTTSGKLHALQYRGLDTEEKKHPRVESLNAVTQQSQEWLQVVPNIEMFRCLLSLFSSGLLDGFPWGCRHVVLGGSAVTACLALPVSMLQNYGKHVQQAAIQEQLRSIVHKTIVKTLRGGPGSVQAATLILDFAAPNNDDKKIMAEMKKKLYHDDTGAAPFNLGDIDIFFSGSSKEDAAEEIATVYQALKSAIRRQSSHGPPEDVMHVSVRTPNSVTLCPKFPYRHVQLVLRIAEHFSEHLAFADLDCTALCYDGCNVWAAPRAKRAFETGYNLVSNHMLTTRKDCVSRIAKYGQRGWGSIVYELCRHEPRCDVCIDVKTQKKLDEARRLMRKPPRFCMRRSYEGNSEDIEVDVAVDLSGGGYDHLHLPRGPQVTPATVIRLLDLQNQQQRVIQHVSTSVVWKDLVEWRREKKLQISGEDHNHAQVTNNESAGSCYCCGARFEQVEIKSEAAGRKQIVHRCVACEKRDGSRRSQTGNLSGYTAVVTGGRCKIGYQVCLKLLRCGAFVVATSRFPRCAAQKFLKEADASDWAPRLHIYGVDFTHFGMLSGFLDQIKSHYNPDILVNNAAQTIRRPPEYYAEVIEEEVRFSKGDEECAGGMKVHDVVRELGNNPWNIHDGTSAETPGSSSAAAVISELPLAVHPSTNLLTDSPHWSGEKTSSIDVKKVFPRGEYDLHGEQLDLRPCTSWTSTLCRGDISGRELLEVLAVNVAAPFMVFQELLPILRRSQAAGCNGCFIVNVTSAEGVFSADGSSAKTSEHPHTNMAKAALNMLTKTAAPELATFGVYCVAVDPGWVSMMRPGDPSNVSRPLPPLSEEDGAARVVAPILDGVETLNKGQSPVYGVLLRNFSVVPW
eukprot:gnl/MRDRNA2_/MRDRNA2_98856_c0_seq1.p1 gnl/MRDRNA2_/MRDRNA2_98856_c0~~gnl/MRDRNA2_/MRDRNA2_98856_c0_seq1.p1  ORF type:complete len:1265 (+),score=232.74 gnl/MRDRNA2_/MRDRNA2_98856_c0_seq1:84-3878(+)